MTPVFPLQPPLQKPGALLASTSPSISGEGYCPSRCAAQVSMKVPLLTYLNFLFGEISNICKRRSEPNYELSIHSYPCTPHLAWLHSCKLIWLPIKRSFERRLWSLGLWDLEKRTHKTESPWPAWWPCAGEGERGHVEDRIEEINVKRGHH